MLHSPEWSCVLLLTQVGPELATITQEFSFSSMKFGIVRFSVFTVVSHGSQELPGAGKGAPKLQMKGDYYAREFIITRGNAVRAPLANPPS